MLPRIPWEKVQLLRSRPRLRWSGRTQTSRETVQTSDQGTARAGL